jgi:hypothetical protein
MFVELQHNRLPALCRRAFALLTEGVSASKRTYKQSTPGYSLTEGEVLFHQLRWGTTGGSWWVFPRLNGYVQHLHDQLTRF